MNLFLRKMQILKISNVAIEIAVEKRESIFINNENGNSNSNLEKLKSGMEEFVTKHGMSLPETCGNCFADRSNIQVGAGNVRNKATKKDSILTVDSVVIVTHPRSDCSSAPRNNKRTEILFFRDFKISAIPTPSLDDFKSVRWSSFGLHFVGLGPNNIEWGEMPRGMQIDMVFHCYGGSTGRPRIGRYLVRNALKSALSNLKMGHVGMFLSDRVQSTLRYVPELARSIASLIVSSSDECFRGECLGLLGMGTGTETGKGTGTELEGVEEFVKEKMVSVLEREDEESTGKCKIGRFLFDDEYSDLDGLISKREESGMQ